MAKVILDSDAATLVSALQSNVLDFAESGAPLTKT
ncbi:hypothetical protein ACP70R_008793 [Stipagrostis hirtigluma subsp. patula]